MVYVDGTFRTAPRPCEQFFTIHGEVNGHVLKLACGLLLDKNTQSYEEVFRAIRNLIPIVTGQPWVVREIITDYETAIMNAAENVFPGLDIRGCYFHFNEALYRKVQALRLARAYERDQELKRLVREIMALGFLPLNLLRMNWNNVQQAPNTLALLQVYPRLAQFLRYFERNWMNPNGSFRPARWNVYRRRMEYRTNNVVEAYNRAWNWFVAARHPSLWVFLTKLKQRQTIHEADKNNMINGLPPPRHRLKWRQLESRFERVKRQCRQGQRTVDQYWNAVVHLIIRHR